MTERELAAPTQADRNAVADYLDRMAQTAAVDCLVDGIFAVAEELRWHAKLAEARAAEHRAFLDRLSAVEARMAEAVASTEDLERRILALRNGWGRRM